MKTEDLLIYLSTNAPQQKRWTPATTLAIAAIMGVAAAFALSLFWLPPRIDLFVALKTNNIVLLKLAFGISVVIAALPIVRDLTIPGRAIGIVAVIAILPFLIMTSIAAYEMAILSVTDLSRLIFDTSWTACLWKVPILGLPAFIMLSLSARRQAPTNLKRAGAYIGLLAGGIGALGYALHCHDDSVLFIAMAYSLAIAEMILFGAVLGPRILRWR